MSAVDVAVGRLVRAQLPLEAAVDLRAKGSKVLQEALPGCVCVCVEKKCYKRGFRCGVWSTCGVRGEVWERDAMGELNEMGVGL